MYKKSIIVLLLVIAIGGLLLIFRENIFEDKTGNNKILEKEVVEDYFVYGYNTVVYFDGEEWEYLEPNDVQWKKFNIYDGNDYLGYYSLQYNKKWYIFDDERMPKKYNYQLFAYSGNKEIELYKDYENFDENDLEELRNLLFAENVVNYGDITYAKKISLNSNSTMYVATNIYSETEKQHMFSVIYVKTGDEIKMLDHFYGQVEEELFMPAYYFDKVFDFRDGIYKILILKTYFGNSNNDCHIMYEITNNGSKKILDCDKIYEEEEKFEVKDDDDKKEEKKSYFIYIIGFILSIISIFIGFLFIKNRKENKI